MKHIFFLFLFGVTTAACASTPFIEDRAVEDHEIKGMLMDWLAIDTTGWELFKPRFPQTEDFQERVCKCAAGQMNLYKKLFPDRTIASMQKDLAASKGAVEKTWAKYQRGSGIGSIAASIICMRVAAVRDALEFLIEEAQRAEKK